ncbi:MAG: FG-GAP repeat protein [Spirochaetota bacterium]
MILRNLSFFCLLLLFFLCSCKEKTKQKQEETFITTSFWLWERQNQEENSSTSTGSSTETSSSTNTSSTTDTGLTSNTSSAISTETDTTTATCSPNCTWIQEAYLKAPNAETNDNFGWAVGISSDTIAVSTINEDSSQTTITNGATASADNSASTSGAVYIFKQNGSTWAQEAYLKAANAEANDEFGYSVSISSDTIAVGARTESSNQTTITNGSGASVDNSKFRSGAVYVFKRSGSTWQQEAYLKTPNADTSDGFGWSVAISSDTIAVGVRDEASNQTTITNGTSASTNNSAAASGAVYVFKRSGSSWAQEAYLKAPNAEAGDTFGDSVAISGDTIVVGATSEDSNQTTVTNGASASADNSLASFGTSVGAAYVFKRSGTTWAQEAYLKAANAGANDNFGISVSIFSDTIAIGASLEDSSQTTITNGTSASTDNSTANSGAVYVFKRSGTTWSQEAYLKAANAGTNDNFGASVSISSDTIAVGAASEDSNQTTITNGNSASTDNSASNSGAVYVFKRTGTTWTQEAYLKAPNAELLDNFGAAIAVSSDTIVVSARNEDSSQTTITNGTTASTDNSASNSGAVYVFKN